MTGENGRRILTFGMSSAHTGRKRQELRRLYGLLIQSGFDTHEIDAHDGLNGVHENDIILVVGGDGTLSRVVNGLKGKKARLAVFPAGLFNTFCRTYALPCSTQGLYSAIMGGEGGAVPVGIMGDSIFISNASIGYKARVVELLRRKGGRRKGYHSYLWPLLKAWFELPRKRLSLRFDDGEEEVTDSPLICIAPDRDGGGAFLHIYIVEDVPRLLFPILALVVFIAVPLRKEITLPGLRCRREERVEFEGQVDTVNLDGEVICAEDLVIEAGMGDMGVVGIDPSAHPRHRLSLR